MVYDSLPFRDFDGTLRENLQHEQIPRICKWLIGPQPTGVLALASNSHWEAALSVEFLLWARELFSANGVEADLCRTITERVGETANRLLSAATEVDIDGDKSCCWDSVTWDTAVVVRALLAARIQCPDDFAEGKVAELEKRIVEALQWLVWRFDVWESDVRFPFGVCDIGQILVTLIYLHSVRPDLIQRAWKTGYIKKRRAKEPVEAAILKYLLKEASELPASGECADPDETLFFWGNFFHTAEVVEALAMSWVVGNDNTPTVFPIRAGTLKKLLPEELLLQAKRAALGGIRYMEVNQVDGEWGTHVDTTRCLYAYVRATYLLGETPEAHLVFRALRWAIDEKQNFSDGSFLHTMFLTIFHAFGLREVYERWSLSAEVMANLYDHVVWSAPARTTPERGMRLQAEMEKDAEERKGKVLEKRLLRWKRCFWTMVALVGGVLVGGGGAHLAGVAEVAKPTVANPADLLAFLSILVAAIGVAIGLIWTVAE